jgi:predicted DNA-binding transcriptional regulator YafY
MAHRIERLLNILLLLQGHPVIRAADLAAQFGVSKRTIYRDLEALGDMGVPLVAMPGEGYALVDGFYMPPLSFTDMEAQALLLGAKMLMTQASGSLTDAAALAVTKIAHILPSATRDDVERVAEIIHFYRPSYVFDLDQPVVQQLHKAIRHRQVVSIVYHSYSEDAPTERAIEPETLFYNEGVWYVEAFCRLRQDVRSFRLDRMTAFRLLNETFVPRLVYPLPDSWIEIRVQVAAKNLRWVRERQHYGYQEDETKQENGDVIMRYRVHQIREIRAWLLGWGAGMVVLSPESLREDIRQEAQTLMSLLT